MENKEIVTTIDGVGNVEAMNDLAHFSLTIRSKSDGLDRAVSETVEKATKAMKMLEDLRERGMKLEGEIISTVSNYKLEHREGNEKIAAGFVSVNVIDWTIAVDEHLDNIFKTCLKFDSNMKAPHFSIKDRNVHISTCLEHAVENAKEKLEKECKLLGVSQDSLMIKNWVFNYDGNLAGLNNAGGKSSYYGVTGVTGPQGAIGSQNYSNSGLDTITRSLSMKVGSIYQEPLDIQITPGTAMFRVAVRVNYIWK